MLIMTLVILASMLIVTLGVSAIAVNGLKAGTNQLQSTKAYFAAEAGAERILWEIRKNDVDPLDLMSVFCGQDTFRYFCFAVEPFGNLSACSTSCSIDMQTLNENNSSYQIKYNNNSTSGLTTIWSYGHFQDINRTIELKY